MKKVISILILILFIQGCTKDFNEINEDPAGISADNLAVKFFITKPQANLFAPGRFAYWRAQLIHADRYAGHFSFGFNGSWWNDGLGYSYNVGYTDAAWGYYSGYFPQIVRYLNLTKPGGDFENEGAHAVGLILKSIYFQLYADTFGEIPFTETGDVNIQQPKFDTLNEIYQGIIADLDNAINLIGDKTVTGEGLEDLGENDLIYKGDLQRWKKFANTLKLRIALRAYGAAGDNFASQAVQSAISGGLLINETDNAAMPKDGIISQWTNATYGDVWHNFGLGSNWVVSEALINELKLNNDPRLSVYATPAEGGSFSFTDDLDDEGNPVDPDFQQRVDFMIATLDKANATYTTSASTNEDGEQVRTIDISSGQFIGHPTRINGDQYPYAEYEMFSKPAEAIIAPKNSGNDITPEIVLLTAEAYFLKAEAIAKGIISGDANSEYQSGIKHAMRFWGVEESDIDNFIANSPMGSLSGTNDLRQISIQRWIAQYTEGFEAWAIVRDSGYPEELATGVNDPIIYSFGDLNGAYPQRLRYGGAAYNLNGDQLQIAIDRQGADLQATKLWWAK